MTGWGQAIRQCREFFGHAPRRLTWTEREDFRLRLSLMQRYWLFRNGDELRLILRDQKILRDLGWVVWGCLVQANKLLFDPDNDLTLPANAVYSPEPYFDDRLPVLRSLGQGVFGLKGTHPRDPSLDEFAVAVTEEMRRTMYLPLPHRITKGRDVVFTTIFIQPSHLPEGYMAAGYFPLLICPEETDAAMILPDRYWPDDLIWAWNE